MALAMSRRGYSVVEIVVVLVLLGAVATTALPQLSSTRGRYAVMHAADEFASAHRLARAIALRNARVAELHIDPAAGLFWVEVDTSAMRTGATDTIGPVRRSSNHNVTMTSTRSLLCFDGRGLATPVWACPPGDATLTFSRGTYADTVRTTLTGKLLR